MDGLPALVLLDLIVSVLGNISRVSDGSGKPVNGEDKHHNSHRKIDVMKDIDAVPSNVQSTCQEALLYVIEDSEAVIKMIIKVRNRTMRHVSRTHRVALDWLFDRINQDTKIQIKYIDTKNQLADILTKVNFKREWNHLLTLFNISHFSSTACTAAKSWSSTEDPVVSLERNLYGHLLARLLWERQFEKILLKHGWEKIPNWECLFVHREKGLFLSVYVDDIKLAGKKHNIDPMWKVLNKEVDLGEPTSFLDHVYLGCTQRKCEISKDTADNYRAMFESRLSAGGLEKLQFPQNLRISSWSYDMAGHAKKCVERYCELANKTTRQLYKVFTTCIDDHHFKEEGTKSVGELSTTCSQIVLKCLYLARIGRPDILWSVNKLARSITKWTKACDKRLNRLISYIHHTCEYKQYCHVGNIAKQCRLGLFQDSDFAGDLEDSKSTSGGTLWLFGSHTFVPISWMCKKQTTVSQFNRI